MNLNYIARQPILDAHRNTIGYELLFRDGPKNAFPDIDPVVATSSVLSNHLFDTTANLLENKPAFINFPHKSIINLVPTLFSNKEIVVEVLEGCPPDEELFAAIKELYQQGYKIALDDFEPSPQWKRFLPYISYIKFDVKKTEIATAKRFIERTRQSKIIYLAEKVETYEQFDQARTAGFTYFQGYFFAKPDMLQRGVLTPAFGTIVQLLKAIAMDHIDYDLVEQIITKDVSLSYKLLHFVNSSAQVTTQIKSFHQALVYLGEDRLRRFISLVAIASTNENKPLSLYCLAIQRARFCELVLKKIKFEAAQGQAFLTGMFSLLDSLLDQPMDYLLDEISIDTEIKRALIEHYGQLGHILQLAVAFEQADWDLTSRFQHTLAIDENTLFDCYEQSLSWAKELTLHN